MGLDPVQPVSPSRQQHSIPPFPGLRVLGKPGKQVGQVKERHFFSHNLFVLIFGQCSFCWFLASEPFLDFPWFAEFRPLFPCPIKIHQHRRPKPARWIGLWRELRSSPNSANRSNRRLVQLHTRCRMNYLDRWDDQCEMLREPWIVARLRPSVLLDTALACALAQSLCTVDTYCTWEPSAPSANFNYAMRTLWDMRLHSLAWCFHIVTTQSTHWASWGKRCKPARNIAVADHIPAQQDQT